MDEIMSFVPETEEKSKKCSMWRIVLVVIAVLAVIAALWWLIADPFAKPSYATFEKSVITVTANGSWNAKTMAIKLNAMVTLRDGTPIPLTVKLVKADITDMTVTLAFNKTLYRDGKALDRVMFCYDETVTLTTSTEADANTLLLHMVLPSVFEEMRGDADPVTCLAGDKGTLRLYDTYYEWRYGKGEKDVSYGVYERDGDTLTLTEQMGLTRYVFCDKGGVFSYDRRASYRHDRAHTPRLRKGDSLRFLYTFEKAHDPASDTYPYSVLNYAGDVLVGGVTDRYSQSRAELAEPTLLCVSAVQQETTAAIGRSMMMIAPPIEEGAFPVSARQYIDLNSGACSDVYEQVLCTTDGGMAHVVMKDGQATLMYEAIPFCSHPIPKTLTVPLGDAAAFNVTDIHVYAENGRLIVDYTQEETRAVTVLNEDGSPCTDPLVTCGEMLYEYGGVSFFTVVDHTASREILLFGVRSAYVYRDGVYLPLSAAFAEAEDLCEKVLADIASGIAARTSWENGVGFTARYGDDRHTITVVRKGEDCAVYVGVTPTAEQLERMVTQYNYR